MNPSCPYCGGATTAAFMAQDWNRRIDARLFEYWRCNRCSLVFMYPVPEDLGRYYPSDYHHIPASAIELAANAEHERYKVDLLTRYCKAGRLIEIGPGNGGFAYLAKAAGFSVRAIEMSAACCRFLEDVVGVEAVRTTSERDALMSGPPADAIALWHVVEHLVDPFDLVRAAAERLSPGGVLILAAPNPSAFQFRLFRGRWTHVDAPRHVTLIPSAVLKQVAEASGLVLALETTLDEGSVGWDSFGWEFSLGTLSTMPRIRSRLRRLGRMLARVFAPIERVEGRGSAYTLVFRKPE
ncbi:MAG: class I SAM-dependent methyltransferase [Burkholderiales bacterium]|nr:class I SAM-dependent methyltransferase [Burkholderiales bacterium]